MKSFLGVVCFLVFFWPAVSVAEALDAKHHRNKVLANANGRYVFGQVSEFRRDQYLLDTQTGRLWVIVADKENNSKLQPIAFVQIWGDEAFIPDPQGEVDEDRKLVRKKTIEDIKKRLDDRAKKK